MDVNHHHHDVLPHSTSSSKSQNNEANILQHASMSFKDTINFVENTKPSLQSILVSIYDFDFIVQTSTLKSAQFAYALNTYIRKQEKLASDITVPKPPDSFIHNSSSDSHIALGLELTSSNHTNSPFESFWNSFSKPFLNDLISFIQLLPPKSSSQYNFKLEFNFKPFLFSLTINSESLPPSSNATSKLTILLTTKDKILFEDLTDSKQDLLEKLTHTFPKTPISLNLNLV
tara:strand:+ start:1072 stop:1764 length:693 start_codon:yes stop_codon:yes gene_type:complete